MSLDLDLFPDMTDSTLRIDQDGGSNDTHVFLAVHLLQLPETIIFDGLVFRIAQDRISQG